MAWGPDLLQHPELGWAIKSVGAEHANFFPGLAIPIARRATGPMYSRASNAIDDETPSSAMLGPLPAGHNTGARGTEIKRRLRSGSADAREAGRPASGIPDHISGSSKRL